VGYRYSAAGNLDIPPRHVDTVCRILGRKSIQYTLDGTTVVIKHTERATTPGHQRPEEPFEEIAPYLEKPQSLTVSSELVGENEIGFADGRVFTDSSEKVWAVEGEAPTPDGLVEALRSRGIAARVTAIKGSRKNGRRSRQFEIQPGSGGPPCKITVRRRFWDSFDLLAIPDVYQPLCRKYHISPEQLRTNLHQAKFGVEVRNPALGGASADLLFDNILEILEEQTEGIRTRLG